MGCCRNSAGSTGGGLGLGAALATTATISGFTASGLWAVSLAAVGGFAGASAGMGGRTGRAGGLRNTGEPASSATSTDFDSEGEGGEGACSAAGFSGLGDKSDGELIGARGSVRKCISDVYCTECNESGNESEKFV